MVANAITAKGVTTATDATFATMANNINSINIGCGVSIELDVSTATFTLSNCIPNKMYIFTLVSKRESTTDAGFAGGAMWDSSSNCSLVYTNSSQLRNPLGDNRWRCSSLMTIKVTDNTCSFKMKLNFGCYGDPNLWDYGIIEVINTGV